LDCHSRGRPPNLLRCARPGRCAWLSSGRGRAVLCRSQGYPRSQPFSLRSAWPLRSARPSSACVKIGLSYLGKTPEPLFPTALGLAAAIGFLQRVSGLCYVVIGGDTRTPLLSCARPCMAAALGLAFFAVRAGCLAVVGGDLITPLLRNALPSRCAWLSLLRRACESD
jgi:hypothetical protein